MKITSVETFACDAGWRNYHFLKIVTDEGVTGWAEFDEAFGPPGLTGVIENYGRRLIGRDAFAHEQLHVTLASTARPAPHGMTAEAFGAIENALLDIKAKALGVPVYELLGGKVRDHVPIYWSHCASWRINHPQYYSPQIRDLNGVREAGVEARERGFKAVKTNMFVHHPDGARAWMAGFGAPFEPGLNIDRKLISSVVSHMEALRDGAGDDVELLLDLNFNARTEGFLKLLRALDDFDLFWVELDLHNPEALAYIRQHTKHPIASLETLFGVRQFNPYLQAQAVDVGIVDAIWNGTWQAMKIAAAAEAHDVNIAPHNFYSHLATMTNVHFAAAVPNLRVMEHDVDRLPWDDELFDTAPQIVESALVVPDAPGWGITPNEEAIRAHPPKVHADYLGFSTT
ncbi:mandelate racemase/muconate lactonizing enzyme family protein [Gordonia jinghuaiqii]|uniref:glucarate dehydratase n=1 Tax=Gordonia jinghuaiqii TaxID=2758710 RepID=A0A7D7LUW8_9ACTN|nr:mandelate racemase/muconate lactonizing enzyme family protein [Gordonia jinghuaiqii]MCR5977512.1 mandelate racemase/muconate lactonizing enzyme family protein [Gordonia jinghuaiqii]QMT02201.1 mandelate racemase/muconate lactonizing enzyme family protein [Gordonia jinghuaiqii]